MPFGFIGKPVYEEQWISLLFSKLIACKTFNIKPFKPKLMKNQIQKPFEIFSKMDYKFSSRQKLDRSKAS